MEGKRNNNYREEVSPERSKVWRERSPKYVQCRKVPVVYYLCRNRQLEHPHFMEVPLSSPDGLYLRDVIERLNILRGRGMASMYSWSSKRSYKNGFVWHDLCENDLILPAHGREYILKGSEIIDESNPAHFSSVVAFRMHNLKELPEPPSSRSQDVPEPTHPQEDSVSPPSQLSGSSVVSPDSRHSSWGGSLTLTDYNTYNKNNEGLTDASTQTEENARKDNPKETRTQGVSTDDENTETHATSSSGSSSAAKAETLENLIRADVSKINNSFRRFEEENIIRMPGSSSRSKASNVLMQLISCGSISVKDHSFGIIPMYRDSKFPSPLYNTSVMLGELDSLSDSARLVGIRLEDKEYFSGSLVETKMSHEYEGQGHTLKRSSSYDADRSSKQLDSATATATADDHDDHEETSSTKSKCIPRSIKSSLIKHPTRSESMRSPRSDKPRVSTDKHHDLRIISHDVSNGGSKRISEPCNGKHPITQEDPLREEEKIVKIEERLASGARIIIQSKEC